MVKAQWEHALLIWFPIRGLSLLAGVRRPLQAARWSIKAREERHCSMGQKIKVGGLMWIYQGDLDIKSLNSSARLYEVLRVPSVHIVPSQRRITL